MQTKPLHFLVNCLGYSPCKCEPFYYNDYPQRTDKDFSDIEQFNKCFTCQTNYEYTYPTLLKLANVLFIILPLSAIFYLIGISITYPINNYIGFNFIQRILLFWSLCAFFTIVGYALMTLFKVIAFGETSFEIFENLKYPITWFTMPIHCIATFFIPSIYLIYFNRLKPFKK